MQFKEKLFILKNVFTLRFPYSRTFKTIAKINIELDENPTRLPILWRHI